MLTPSLQYAASDIWNEISDTAYVLPNNRTMTAEESSEYSLLYGDIQTLVVEYYCGIIGSFDINVRRKGKWAVIKEIMILKVGLFMKPGKEIKK